MQSKQGSFWQLCPSAYFLNCVLIVCQLPESPAEVATGKLCLLSIKICRNKTGYFSSARNKISRLLILTALICLRHEGSLEFSLRGKNLHIFVLIAYLPGCQKAKKNDGDGDDSKEFS